MIRDPVVLTATLPRFLLNGDHGTVNLEIDNVEGAGRRLRHQREDRRPGEDDRQSRNHGQACRQAAQLVRARRRRDGGAGTATLDVDIKGPNGLALARHYALDVKAATQVLARRTVRTLAKGESLTLTSDMFADLVPGTGSVSVSAGLSTALDAATLLKALDRYPYGCSEQITSRAMPLLYVNELAAGAHLAMDAEVDQRIRDAIERLLARQGSNGSFGLWSAGGDDAWLDAYVTDFLTRAREKGFAVPDVLFKLALDRLRNSVVNGNEPEKDGGRDLAYGLYVLARNGAAPIGDLRYLADTKLEQPRDPDREVAARRGARAGRRPQPRGAGLWRRARQSRAKTGAGVRPHRLRLAASRCRSAGVARQRRQCAAKATLTQAVARVETARGLTPYTSTQENAWLVLAARALAKENLSMEVDGAAGQDRAVPQLQGRRRWRASR